MARRKNKKNIRPIGCVLIADGETEHWYVGLIKRHYGLNIKIKPELSPVSIEKQYDMVRNSLNDGYEHVFWIIDFDNIRKENYESTKNNSVLSRFRKYYEKAKNNDKWIGKLTIIVNNPCFEYWFYIHGKPSTTKYFASYDELLLELRKFKVDANLFANYTKSEKCFTGNAGIYERLLPYLKKIDFHKLKSFDFDSCQNEGVSEMYRLFENLNIQL